jgi:hypothetical protein
MSARTGRFKLPAVILPPKPDWPFGRTIRLGVNQWAVLQQLVRYGIYPRGWHYGTRSCTETTLTSLCNHSPPLAEKKLIQDTESIYFGLTITTPTEDGKQVYQLLRKLCQDHP